jgi:uncharacterized membrane protein
MSSRPRFQKGKIISLSALSVLIGIIITSAFLPLRPSAQQALIGIALVWIGVTAMVGCSF